MSMKRGERSVLTGVRRGRGTPNKNLQRKIAQIRQWGEVRDRILTGVWRGRGISNENLEGDDLTWNFFNLTYRG